MSKVRLTKAQLRVFVLLDNTMPIYSEPSRTVYRMQKRGWLAGDQITKRGYEVFDAARNGRDSTAKYLP